MDRRGWRENEPSPWLRPDVQANRISSADWGENHPGLCYEFGDPNGEPFISTPVLESVFLHKRFVTVLWQPRSITLIDVSHNPGRTFFKRHLELGENDWCDINHYELTRDNPELIRKEKDIDPQDVMEELAVVLRTPLGYPLSEHDQTLLPSSEPVKRILIEFPYNVETEPLPLDTCITALGAIARENYQHTIYGSPKV